MPRRTVRPVRNGTSAVARRGGPTVQLRDQEKRGRGRLLIAARTVGISILVLGTAAGSANAQVFNNTTYNASVSGGFSSGVQDFNNSTFNADIANSATGTSTQDLFNSTLNATATNAINGSSTQVLSASVLNANATNAVNGGKIQMLLNSTVQVNATNALSNQAWILFSNTFGTPAGTLQLNGHDTTVGKLSSENGFAGTSLPAGTIKNGGATAAILTVDTSVRGDSSYSGLLTDGGSGSLGLTKTGTGTLTLQAQSTYSGPTLVSGGTLRTAPAGDVPIGVAANALSRNSAYTIAAGATLDLNGYDQVIGSLAGAGRVILRSGGPSGPAALSTGFDNTSTTFSGTISGATIFGGDELWKIGSGTLILTGDNTYTGRTLINGGTLQLGNGGTTGSVAGDIMANGTLVFDRSDALTFNGAISGSGGVQQNGSGSVTLSANESYTGSTSVNAGMLFVTGALQNTSGVIVANGAALGGTGSVRNVIIQNGGTLLPGVVGTPGALTVNGSLTFNSGAAYLVQGAAPSIFGKTNVTGTATLTGANAFVTFASGAYKAGTYTLLTANGGLNGTQFASFNTLGLSNTSGIRNPHLTYDANDVFLVLDVGTVSILPGFTSNQAAAANGINNAVNAGANPNNSFLTVLGFTGTQLTNALTQFEGTTPGGATIAAVQLMNGFLNLMQHPAGGPPQISQGGFGGGMLPYAAEASALPREVQEAYAAAMPVKAAPAQTPFASRWTTWAAGFGGTGHVNGQAGVGTADTDARAYAIAGGAEYKLSRDTALGFALAGGGTSWGLSQNLGTGAGDAFQIGGYATHNFGAAYLSGAVAYAWHDMHTDRTVTAVGAEQLHASFRAQGFGGRFEGGYRVAHAWVNVTPYGALQVQTFRTPSYSEIAQSGAGAFALSYASRSTTATRTELGAWFDKPFVVATDRVLLLRGRLAWAHDHSSDPTLNALFQTLPGSNFGVNTTAMPSNLALVTAGTELKFASNWSIGAKFDGEFSDHSQTYTGTGVIKRVW